MEAAGASRIALHLHRVKVTATPSIVGALIGELPVGFQTGLGRALLTFSSQFAVQSRKLYGTVIVCAAIGVFFVWLVSWVEKRFVPQRAVEGETL